jgi:hypothetical protein
MMIDGPGGAGTAGCPREATVSARKGIRLEAAEKVEWRI